MQCFMQEPTWSGLPAPPPPPAPPTLPPTTYGQPASPWSTGYAPPSSPYGQAPAPSGLGSIQSPYDGVRCQQCGSVPALPVKFGRVTGLILMFRLHKVEFAACRSCALSVGRAQQSKTMMTGWWGFISFFCNIWYVLRNALSLLRVSKLAAPAGGVSTPLDPGRSALLRLGPLVTVLFFGAWIAIATASEDPATWSNGSCVSVSVDEVGEEIAEPTHCRNDGRDIRIVSAVRSADQCPAKSDAFVTVESSNMVYCVDEPS